MQTKAELRFLAKNLRKELDIKDISKRIISILNSLSLYKNAKNIAAYYPIGTEIDLSEIFENKNKKFYLPKIFPVENKMNFYAYVKGDKLKNNKYNIPEPSESVFSPKKLDIIIIPALMCDKLGYRLGYGKGYYDRFLAENTICAKKVILIPRELMCENLPKEKFDVPADVIVTQEGAVFIN